MSLANLSYAVSFTASLMLSVLLYFDYHSFDYYYFDYYYFVIRVRYF